MRFSCKRLRPVVFVTRYLPDCTKYESRVMKQYLSMYWNITDSMLITMVMKMMTMTMLMMMVLFQFLNVCSSVCGSISETFATINEHWNLYTTNKYYKWIPCPIYSYTSITVIQTTHLGPCSGSVRINIRLKFQNEWLLDHFPLSVQENLISVFIDIVNAIIDLKCIKD